MAAFYKNKKQFLAVDHSARASMKNAASCENECELQNSLIIDTSNAHGGSGLRGPCHVRLRVGRSYKSKSIHLLLARALGFRSALIVHCARS